MQKYFFAIAWLLVPSLLPAQRSSFAIVVDTRHLERLRPEIDLYRQSLEQDGLTVGQAALVAGYNSAANFATAYRKRFGMPPKLARGRI